MLANNFNTSKCFAISELIKFMCFGSTLIYPHEDFLILRPPRTRSMFNPHSSAPAHKAVRVPAPAPQMRVPATRADQPAPRRTLVLPGA